jgi:hypothetical protein
VLLQQVYCATRILLCFAAPVASEGDFRKIADRRSANPMVPNGLRVTDNPQRQCPRFFESPAPHSPGDIAAAPTPGIAKRMGRTLRLRDDWEQIKTDTMRYLVRLKFRAHPELARRLLETGNAELIEANTWGDVMGCPSGDRDRREPPWAAS